MRYLLVPTCLALAACGTPEYRAERSACVTEWTQRIPADLHQQLVERYRYEQRPTGRSTCTTTGNTTNCVQEMTTISIPYTAVETVDRNKPRRDAQIAACAARACVQKYGNSECKTG